MLRVCICVARFLEFVVVDLDELLGVAVAVLYELFNAWVSDARINSLRDCIPSRLDREAVDLFELDRLLALGVLVVPVMTHLPKQVLASGFNVAHLHLLRKVVVFCERARVGQETAVAARADDVTLVGGVVRAGIALTALAAQVALFRARVGDLWNLGGTVRRRLQTAVAFLRAWPLNASAFG